jgi:1-phosphofructokinase
MIYTVTFNPALDYVMHVGTFAKGETNRSDRDEMYVGGKGINVAVVLGRLGIKAEALGFVAGFTGDEIERAVKAEGVECDFVHLAQGFSRINVKIKSGCETELNGCGPQIRQQAVDELFKKIDRLENGDTLVLAGSIPSALPADIYERILARLDGRGVRTAVDATGALLVNVLRYRPFLIKPNDRELGEIFSRELKTDEEIIECAQALRKKGAVNVLVSMAGRGSILADEFGKIHRIGTAKGKLINSVGAGDSMVAGFLAGCMSGPDYDYALRLGTACGGATAFSNWLADKETVDKLMSTL